MKLLTLELVLRNWWRNKLFFFISLLSLTIGIACASLLVTFVIYEYAIEDTNPYRKELMMLTSDSPFEKANACLCPRGGSCDDSRKVSGSRGNPSNARDKCGFCEMAKYRNRIDRVYSGRFRVVPLVSISYSGWKSGRNASNRKSGDL